MAEEEVDRKELPGPSQPPFLEVLCKSCGKVRRFASGTDAGFALSLINSKLGFGVPPGLYIEAAKDGEEPVSFGPKAALVNYGEGWKLQTAIEEVMREGSETASQKQHITKQISSLMPSESRYIGNPAAGTNPSTSCQYIVRILIAFALMFLLGGALVLFLENLPWLIQLLTTTNGDGKGKSSLDGGDLHQFILLKRATLPKSSIDKLKEKILGNALPEVSSPGRVNHLISNNHRDHDGIKKVLRTMKDASPWMKKLTIIRKYRKLKNQASGASQEISNTQQHFLKQHVPDEKKINQQTNVDGGCNAQFLTTEKTKTNTCEEFHDIGMQSRKNNLSGFVHASNCDPDNFKGSHRSGQQSRKKNILHDGRADLQEVADGACDDDVRLLEQSSMPCSSSAQNLCIKCSRGGQLLNCHGDGCSRSIHESCLGLLATVEENGLFYCPFCAYRNARMMYEKSKRKAQEARRNLFSFYDIGPAVHLKRTNSSAEIMPESGQENGDHSSSEHPDSSFNPQFQDISGTQKHDDTQNQQNQRNGLDDIVCKIILPCRETIECDIHKVVEDTPEKLKSDSGREHEGTKVTEDQQPVDDHGVNISHDGNGDARVTNSTDEVFRDEEIKNVHTGYADLEQISLQAGKRSPLKVEGDYDHNAKRKALASQISDSFSKRNRRDKTIRTDNYHGFVENQQTDSPSLRELRRNTHRQFRCLSLKQSPSRRTKLIWKPEEEEVLEEAMQKIPKNEDGSIPWTKILEYGRRFLHESRTPIDLKDKWRNMQRKEAKKRV